MYFLKVLFNSDTNNIPMKRGRRMGGKRRMNGEGGKGEGLGGREDERGRGREGKGRGWRSSSLCWLKFKVHSGRSCLGSGILQTKNIRGIPAEYCALAP